jgi:hypothetical protein
VDTTEKRRWADGAGLLLRRGDVRPAEILTLEEQRLVFRSSNANGKDVPVIEDSRRTYPLP